MSFLFFETKVVLSEKNSEELVSLKSELTAQLSDLSVKKQNLKMTHILLQKNFDEIDKNIKLILKEIKRREDNEETKNIIGEDINSIEGFELLSEDELSIITKNMDRTDYRKYGVPVRFYDLERICREVISMKKKYPKWILTKLLRGGQYDRLPPHTFYSYEYKDEDLCRFTLGGIKLIS
jgi:hypothetical protein